MTEPPAELEAVGGQEEILYLIGQDRGVALFPTGDGSRVTGSGFAQRYILDPRYSLYWHFHLCHSDELVLYHALFH